MGLNSRLLLVLFFVLFQKANAQPTIAIADKGVMDCRSFSLQENAVALEGSWQFFPHQLVTPDAAKRISESSFKTVPSWWPAGSVTPPLHVATYRLRVLLSPEDAGGSLALEVPDIYSSYSLWVNNKPLGGNGKVGLTENQVVPQWRPQTFVIAHGRDTLDILIQVANFHHHRTGLADNIYLGPAEKFLSTRARAEVTSTILFFSLLAFSVAALFIFWRKKKKQVALVFYACLCISWAFRSIFSNQYVIIQWYPDISWNLSLRVEYITIYLSTLFGSLLIGALFPKDVGKTARQIYLTVCSIFTLFTLFTPPLLFTRYVQLYLAFSGLLLISILVIVFRAYLESRQGMGILIYCLFLAAVLFGYVILSYEGLFVLNPFIFNGGFLLLFFAGGIATLNRLVKIEAGEGDLRDHLNFR